MSQIETPIGDTGAKLVTTDGSDRKVFLADGKQASFTVKPDGTATVRTEISYQKEQLKIVKDLLAGAIESDNAARAVKANPNSTPDQIKNADRDLKFSSTQSYSKQVQEKSDLLETLFKVEDGMQAAWEANDAQAQGNKTPPDNANSKTAGDAVNKNTDGTGKDASGDPTAEKLSDEEKKNIEDSNKSTESDTKVVTDNKTSTGQAPSKANEEAKQGLFATPQYSQYSQGPSSNISVGNTGEKPVPIKVTPNPLHAYATYTYSISLHLLTPEAYNTLAEGGDWLPEAKTLIAGGGRWGTDKTNKNTFTRAAQFKDDFYFDGLSLETIIGLNTQSKGANAIEFKFTIVEPYGFTLINRLLELSLEMNQPNYLTNPYVLQIDFFGNNDAGEPVHPCTDSEGRSLTKFLPCRIVEVLAKVGTAGATYACRAVPYSHAAFAETVGVTPANFEVVASTVGNFFTNDVDDAALVQQAQTRFKQTRDAERENIAATAQATTPEKKAEAEAQAKKIASNAKAPFTAKSYTGAYNAYQQYLVLNKFCESPVIIKFNIDPEIANSKIVLKESNSVANTPAVDANNTKEKQAHTKGNKTDTTGTTRVAAVKNDTARFNVNAGDQILELINKVMRNSEYITNQLKDKDDAIQEGKNGETPTNKKGKPLKWFKVVPQLKLTKFDKIRNDWGSEITYHIIPFEHHNSKHPAVSKSNDNEIRKNLRKKYSYIYSGENNDIIDFALDFNTVFYTAVNVMTENSSRFSTAPDGTTAKPVEGAELADSAPDSQISKGVQRNVIHLTNGDISQGGLNASGNPAAQRAADLMKSIYSSARGDMINVQLKIVGDPDFIKTDDVYYNPGNANYPEPDETHGPDGSILTDRGDIFSLLSWRTPADLDQETGFPDFTRFQNSAFDGVYKIIKVTCDFAKGGFEQTLNMIRYHDGVADIIEETGNVARGKASKDPAANLDEKVIGNKATEKELPQGSRKATDAASLREAQNAARGNETDQEQNANLAKIAANGNVKNAEQDSRDQSTSQDNTVPTIAEAQAQSPQADGGPPVKNEGGSQPRSENPPKIDNNNLPAGVTKDPDTGLYLYRGRRFSANDSADLAAKTKAIDDGTSVKTTKTDAESGQKKDVEFNGASPKPESNNADVAKLQQDYYNAQAAAEAAQRRLNNANSGMFDDDPAKKQKIIDGNTKLLNDANAAMASLSEQLKARGAAPREEINSKDIWN